MREIQAFLELSVYMEEVKKKKISLRQREIVKKEAEKKKNKNTNKHNN